MVCLLAFSPDLPVENLMPEVIGLDGEAFDQEGSALVIGTRALIKEATQGFPAPLPGEDMTRSLQPRGGSGGGYHCGACVMSEPASTAGMPDPGHCRQRARDGWSMEKCQLLLKLEGT